MLVVALGLPGSGCLNPRPEELPSANLLPETPESDLAPIRETCDGNPLLVGCELPEEDINGETVSDDGVPVPGDTPGLSGETAPQPTAPADEAPGGGDGAGGDAGTDIPADAGAP